MSLEWPSVNTMSIKTMSVKTMSLKGTSYPMSIVGAVDIKTFTDWTKAPKLLS